MNTWIASLLVVLVPATFARAAGAEVASCPDQTVSNCPGYTKEVLNADTCVQYTTILILTFPSSKTRCASYLLAPPHRHCESSPESGMRCVPGQALQVQLFKCACVVVDASSGSQACRCEASNVGTHQDWALASCEAEHDG